MFQTYAGSFFVTEAAFREESFLNCVTARTSAQIVDAVCRGIGETGFDQSGTETAENGEILKKD